MSGFVYLWYDKKHKRYYLGSHWGFEDDGYICSSNNMRHNYKNRSYDFKRRIISVINTNRFDLLIEEQRWLNMIKSYEFGRKYYNISKTANGIDWTSNEETVRVVREKMQKCWDAPRSEAQLKASTKNVIGGLKNNPAVKKGWVPTHRIGVKDSIETKEKRINSRKQWAANNPDEVVKMGKAISAGKKAKNNGVRRKQVLEYLKDKDWMTSVQISNAVSISKDHAYHCLNGLCKDGIIMKKMVKRERFRDAYWKI